MLMRSKMIDSIVSYSFYDRRTWFRLSFYLRFLSIFLDWNQRRESLFSWWFSLMFFFWLNFQLSLSSTVLFVCIDITSIYYSLSVRKQPTTQFDSRDLAKEIVKYVFIVRNFELIVYWRKLVTKRRRRRKRKRKVWNYD